MNCCAFIVYISGGGDYSVLLICNIRKIHRQLQAIVQKNIDRINMIFAYLGSNIVHLVNISTFAVFQLLQI